MRILHTVEFYPPSTGGMQEVVRQISEHLALRGHAVTVATSRIPERKSKTVANVAIEEFAISGNAVRGFQGEVERYGKFLCESRFDVMTNFAAQQWATDIALPLLDKIPVKKVFVPTGFSGLYLQEYRDYFDKMKSWMKKYDMNVFLSNTYRDIQFARENSIAKIQTIPNGASEQEFLETRPVQIREKLGIPADHFIILHVGSHTSLKGHAEAIEIFRRARLRNVTLLMIGETSGSGCGRLCHIKKWLFSDSPLRSRNHKRIVISSLPRPNTIEAYKEADLFLFPSNIECSPLVLFECMASKTPFLTTDTGNAVEIVGWSKSGLVLPTRIDAKGYSRADIAGSATMLEDIFFNEILRKEMALSGFQAWKEGFTWGIIARKYEEMYKNLIES